LYLEIFEARIIKGWMLAMGGFLVFLGAAWLWVASLRLHLLRHGICARKPSWLDVPLSKINNLLKLSDFVTVPAAIVFLAIVHGRGQEIFILVGWLVWTLVEYWLHRALHCEWMGPLYGYHKDHHRFPEQLVGGTLYTTLGFISLCAAAWFERGLAVFFIGFLAVYLVFIAQHLAHHRNVVGKTYDFGRCHAIHHDGADRCFGVTILFWDLLFGTGSQR